MLLTLLAWIVISSILLGLLAMIGRISLVRELVENDQIIQVIRGFHENLVTYANSRGSNQNAFRELTMKSTVIEDALGWDNIVTGVRVGMYRLNNAPLIPIAIQEMRREYSDSFGFKDNGGEIADAIQTVLFRNVGRRSNIDARLRKKTQRIGSCVIRGWSIITALPISALHAFGLLNTKTVVRARHSFIFRLWNLLLALAAISSPVIAYLADRQKIDAAIRLWFS